MSEWELMPEPRRRHGIVLTWEGRRSLFQLFGLIAVICVGCCGVKVAGEDGRYKIPTARGEVSISRSVQGVLDRRLPFWTSGFK
jgi:hypothetical protein